MRGGRGAYYYSLSCIDIMGGRIAADPGPGAEGDDTRAHGCRLGRGLSALCGRVRAGRYLRGRRGPVARTPGRQMAEAIGETRPRGVQRLVPVL